MDRALNQLEQQVETSSEFVQLETLSDLHLAMIAGGIADTIAV